MDRVDLAVDPLGAIPSRARLPAGTRERTRFLLDAMIESCPSPDMKRLVVDQLEAFGLKAVSLVHNHGTRIVVVPRRMKVEEAYQKYRLSQQDAKDLKSDVGGLFDGMSNTIFLREDMLSAGLEAHLSAFVARHEFAHALGDAVGAERDFASAFLKAKDGDGGRTVSGYAGTNTAEYFADSAAAYLTPHEEFIGHLNPLERAMYGPAALLEGLEAPTREVLEKRDPRARALLDDLFRKKLPAAATRPHRRRDASYEMWLWRAHQVDPARPELRIGLLEIQKQRARGPEADRLEAAIQAEYHGVESHLQAEIAAHPQDTKAVWRLLSHYWERADRLPDGPDRSSLEDRCRQVFAAVDGRSSLSALSAMQNYDYLASQFRQHRMLLAEQDVRSAQDRQMQNSAEPRRPGVGAERRYARVLRTQSGSHRAPPDGRTAGSK